MKLTQPALVLTASVALFLSGCDQAARQAEAQRLAEERAALERDKAALAEARANALENATEVERRQLAAERAELDREKNRLAAELESREQAEREARSAADREARMAAERKAAEEAAARREAEAREREARENAEQSQVAQTVDFFYEALDPYGEWIELERYGYAFRPNTNQVALWRPYTDGGWVYTEYGWTWRSNEPFGWATYHYGRWAKLPRLGWVWIPGTEWGPAWVSWRRSSDYIGWAPLPPDAWSSKGFNASVDSYFDIGPGLYTFLRVADFGEPTYVGRVVEPEQNLVIINNTVNITKNVYKVINNKTTIVNEGPDLTVINKAARRPVQQLKVQKVETATPRAGKVEGGTLQLVAPVLKKPDGPAKPKKIKESVKASEVDRGWKEAKADVQKVRDSAAKQAREAEEGERRDARVVKPAPAPAPSKPAPAPGQPAPEVQPKPVVQPPPAISPRPGRPPVPGAEGPASPNRPNRPDRPDRPADPGNEPAKGEIQFPEADKPPFNVKMNSKLQRKDRPGKPLEATPSEVSPREPAAGPQPDAAPPATPVPGQAPLKQFRRKIEQPTPVRPDGNPPGERKPRQ